MKYFRPVTSITCRGFPATRWQVLPANYRRSICHIACERSKILPFVRRTKRRPKELTTDFIIVYLLGFAWSRGLPVTQALHGPYLGTVITPRVLYRLLPKVCSIHIAVAVVSDFFY